MLRELAMSTLVAALMLAPVAQAVAAPAFKGLFDVDARRAVLQTPTYADIRNSCLSTPIDPAWQTMPVIGGLAATEGYGTDRSANDFNWAVMVLTGHSLAGDPVATSDLRSLLLKWSAAHAFGQTAEEHDAYYSLKRAMLPVVVAYTVVQPALSAAENAQIKSWIDPLVRRVDKLFDGDVDVNNHRDLADSVLMLWGSVVGDQALIDKGVVRFKTVLAAARPDGSIPLETRRGARALWYTRQALTSMVVMAEVARGQGINLYDTRVGSASVWKLFGFLTSAIDNPVLVDAYAAQNYIPGPEEDYRKTDFGFLQTRSNGRNYLASLEAVMAAPPGNFAARAIASMFAKYAEPSRPLIDEFVGGNATCFWEVPK